MTEKGEVQSADERKETMKRLLEISAMVVVAAMMMVGSFAGLHGCATVQQEATKIETKVQGIDWVGFTEQAISAVNATEKLSRVGIGLPCKFGLLDTDVCALYALADAAAQPAIANAQAAEAAYKANPSAGNEGMLKVAYQTLCAAWDAYNQANGKASAAAVKTPAAVPTGQTSVISPGAGTGAAAAVTVTATPATTPAK